MQPPATAANINNGISSNNGMEMSINNNNNNNNNNINNRQQMEQQEMLKLQQFVQGQLSLAISAEQDGQQQLRLLDGQFPSCSGMDAALFSPSQQQSSSRGGAAGDEACCGEENGGQKWASPEYGTSESAAKLLASAFLLDQQQQQQQQLAAMEGGPTKNNVMASIALQQIAQQQQRISPSSSSSPSEGQGEKEEEGGVEEGIDGKNKLEEEETKNGEMGENGTKNGREKCKEEGEKREEMPGNELEAKGGGGQEQDRRTSDLIRKQLAEIEKEIARRMQNKNVKKMDEQEMSQLLLDHGLAGFTTSGGGGNGVDDQKSALPPFSVGNSPSKSASTIAAPSLDQLRQNAVATPPHTHQQQHFPQQHPPSMPQSMPPFSGNGGGGGGFFPQPFGPFPMQFSHVPPDQFVHPQFASLAHHQSSAPSFAFPSSHYSAPFLPQQQSQQQFPQQSAMNAAAASASQSPSPPMAQMLPPNLSAITPEMAAALLAQLQQHNPGLLQSFVAQQQQQPAAGGLQNRISATSGPPMENGIIANGGGPIGNANSAAPLPTPLPAPPRAKPGVAVGAKRQQPQQRRASISGGNGRKGEEGMVGNGGEGMQRQNSAEWAGEGGMGGQNASSTAGGQIANGTAGGMDQPVWVMRESYLKRREREEQRRREQRGQQLGQSEGPAGMMLGGDGEEAEEEEETDRLLLADATIGGGGAGGGKMGGQKGGGNGGIGIVGDHREQQQPQQRNSSLEQMDGEGAGEGDGQSQGKASRKGSKKEVIIHEPAVLIEGVLFRARYLGSTQMTLDGRPTKSSRMAQAQEAVARVKAPEGEPQPSTEIDLFISTEKIMVLNTDLQRISETDVRQDILMDHSLRSISYIADIGDLVVLMARRVPNQQEQQQPQQQADECDGVRKAPRVICHVFESDEANFIAQSIGQAFQVAYVEFLRANGIEDPNYLRDIDYQEVLNSQEMMAEELELLARKETQKDVVVTKRSGEALGVVIVESGWGSMLPTSVIANMAPGGAAARSNQLNIGDQIIGINGISLVGLPLSAAQQNIKNARSSTAVRLTIVSTPPVVEVRIRRPDTKYQLGFSVQNGVICSLLRGGIAERGGIRVGHRIIEINHQSVVAVPHERIVNMLATATGEIHMKTMPTSMFRLLTGQEVPNYI